MNSSKRTCEIMAAYGFLLQLSNFVNVYSLVFVIFNEDKVSSDIVTRNTFLGDCIKLEYSFMTFPDNVKEILKIR